MYLNGNIHSKNNEMGNLYIDMSYFSIGMTASMLNYSKSTVDLNQN